LGPHPSAAAAGCVIMSADPTASAAIAPNIEVILNIFIPFNSYFASNLAAVRAAQSMAAK
jgi:hypothetical protein